MQVTQRSGCVVVVLRRANCGWSFTLSHTVTTASEEPEKTTSHGSITLPSDSPQRSKVDDLARADPILTVEASMFGSDGIERVAASEPGTETAPC